MLSSLASTCLTLLFPALTLSNGLQRSHFKKEEEKRFKWKRNHFGTLVGFTESLRVHAFSRSVLALGNKTKPYWNRRKAWHQADVHTIMCYCIKEKELVLFYSQTCLGKLYIFFLLIKTRQNNSNTWPFCASICLKMVIGLVSLECWNFKSHFENQGFKILRKPNNY